jgi:hypothetical protein
MQARAKSLYRTLAGAVTLFAVGFQYWSIVLQRSDGAVFTPTVHFFSFFTILTNILAALALLLPVVAPASRAARFLDRPAVRTAIAGYIIVVGGVYYLLLRNLGHEQGWTLFFEHVLHYVTPPLFVLDWLLFVPKGEVAWRNGIASLGFPAVYAAWTLGHGALSGWYPYPFLDVPDLGYPRTLLNIAGLVLAFLALELLLVGIGRLINRRGRQSPIFS